MDSLHHLLSDKNFDEPPEIASIKEFVRRYYDAEVGVQMRDHDIVVKVPNASLASRLRFDLPKLKKTLTTDKRIVLRIG